MKHLHLPFLFSQPAIWPMILMVTLNDWIVYLLCISIWFIFRGEHRRRWVSIRGHSLLLWTIGQSSRRSTHGKVFQHVIVDLRWDLSLLDNLWWKYRLTQWSLYLPTAVANYFRIVELEYATHLFNGLKSGPILTKVSILLLSVTLLFLVRVLAHPIQSKLDYLNFCHHS